MSAKDQNFLFISIEDLNDWIEPLGGHADTKTPNMTRLADRGVTFHNAYAAAPACAPSRTATMYGAQPWDTGVYGNRQRAIDVFPKKSMASIVGQMKDAGFTTIGAGKIFHGSQQWIDEAEWDDYLYLEEEIFEPISKAAKNGSIRARSDFGAVPNSHKMFDQKATNFITSKMSKNAVGQFWGLGLFRPHLPFVVPQEFFDAIPETVANPPGLRANSYNPTSSAETKDVVVVGQKLARQWSNIGKAIHNTNEYNDFVRAYLASIHYADYLLGQLLDRLDALELWDTTTVILWSDHGWQLGEKLAFRKFTLWERALRVPLIIASPNAGKGTCKSVVSLTDLAPTLCDLADHSKPKHFSGRSLKPLLRNNNLDPESYSVSIWGEDFDSAAERRAISVRSSRYRFTLYWDGSQELFDHDVDPFEHENLLNNPTSDFLEAIEPELNALLDQIPSEFAASIKSETLSWNGKTTSS